MSPRIEAQDHRRSVVPRPTYQPGPELSGVRGQTASLIRGHSGQGVTDLQSMLNAAGAQPPLAQDGLFGPKTQAALRQFQERHGIPATGTLDAATLSAIESAPRVRPSAPPPSDVVDPTRRDSPTPRAPQQGAPAPSGAIPAGSLARDEEARRNAGRAPNAPAPTAPNAPAAPNAPRPVTPLEVAPGSPRADGELQAIQHRTMDAARRDLDAGVREDRGRYGNNRGPRIDQYARDAGMTPGGEWCGYFSSFQYSQAANESGGTFTGRHHMHSFQKARAYFEYRNYTNNSSAENGRLDTLRAQHEAEGSTRRFMTLSGSGGDRHATANNRPHEVYEPSTLPIREGDTALFSHGHVGLVESYNRETGMLTTIEGNSTGEAVRRKTYDLNDPAVRARFEGFGRPARGDFAGVPAAQ